MVVVIVGSESTGVACRVIVPTNINSALFGFIYFIHAGTE